MPKDRRGDYNADERLRDYVDVAERLRQFRDAYPDGSLQPLNPAEPIQIVEREVTVTEVDDQGVVVSEQKVTRTFFQYIACAYRHPKDRRPGIGIAWEPFPGLTPYTKNSEAMNAETSAWGRAVAAALASETRHVATREEVQNRNAEQNPQPEQDLSKLDEAMNILASATDRKELAHAWNWAGRYRLHDAPIPGADQGYLYRHLWKDRQAAVDAGLGEETKEPPDVAPADTWEIVRFPNGEVDQVSTLRNEVEWKKARGIPVGPQDAAEDVAQAPADADADVAQAAEQAVADGLDGTVVDPASSPEVTGGE